MNEDMYYEEAGFWDVTKAKYMALGLTLGPAFLIAFLFFSPRPAEPAHPYSTRSATMGTYLNVTVHPDNPAARRAAAAAEAEVERLNAVFSAYQKESLLSQVNAAGPQGCTVTAEFLTVYGRAAEMWRLTGGAFDVTVGPLMQLWGFQRKQGRVPTAAEIRETLRHVGLGRVSLDSGFIRLESGMSLDFGALVKGYAVDRAADILRRRGLKNFMVDLGGNIYAAGRNPEGLPWRIGLRDPRDTTAVNAVIELSDAAVATSGDYERMFIQAGKRYAHIINPKTGRPVAGMAATTVIADDAFTADCYSTAYFLSGPERRLEDSGVRGVLFSLAPAAEATLHYYLTPGMAAAMTDSRLPNAALLTGH